MGLLNDIKNAVERMVQPPPPPDVSRFDDPVAEQTEWGPAARGGTNIGTHTLREISRQRMEFRARPMALLFPGLFMVIGLAIGIGVPIAAINGGKDQVAGVAVGILFGLVFFAAGFFIFRSFTTPRVFDLQKGAYWLGRREPLRGMSDSGVKDYCELEEVHAIQLIRERCHTNSSRGRSRTYYSYELNLVMHDGERINVVDHGKQALIRSDAKTLAKFLDVPLWEAC